MNRLQIRARMPHIRDPQHKSYGNAVWHPRSDGQVHGEQAEFDRMPSVLKRSNLRFPGHSGLLKQFCWTNHG